MALADNAASRLGDSMKKPMTQKDFTLWPPWPLEGHPCSAILNIERPAVTYQGKPITERRCGKVDNEKPMCFRGEPWCCDNHRKLVESQRAAESVEDNGGSGHA